MADIGPIGQLQLRSTSHNCRLQPGCTGHNGRPQLGCTGHNGRPQLGCTGHNGRPQLGSMGHNGRPQLGSMDHSSDLWAAARIYGPQLGSTGHNGRLDIRVIIAGHSSNVWAATTAVVRSFRFAFTYLNYASRPPNFLDPILANDRTLRF